MAEQNRNPLAGRFGGTFAPPLDNAKLQKYQKLIDKQPAGLIKEGMQKLSDMMSEFGKHAKSTESSRPHPSGVGTITPLNKDTVTQLDQFVPYNEELQMYQTAFDSIPAEDKELRDAAFHLLWFGRELFLDRQPLTADQLTNQ